MSEGERVEVLSVEKVGVDRWRLSLSCGHALFLRSEEEPKRTRATCIQCEATR